MSFLLYKGGGSPWPGCHLISLYPGGKEDCLLLKGSLLQQVPCLQRHLHFQPFQVTSRHSHQICSHFQDQPQHRGPCEGVSQLGTRSLLPSAPLPRHPAGTWAQSTQTAGCSSACLRRNQNRSQLLICLKCKSHSVAGLRGTRFCISKQHPARSKLQVWQVLKISDHSLWASVPSEGEKKKKRQETARQGAPVNGHFSSPRKRKQWKVQQESQATGECEYLLLRASALWIGNHFKFGACWLVTVKEWPQLKCPSVGNFSSVIQRNVVQPLVQKHRQSLITVLERSPK